MMVSDVAPSLLVRRFYDEVWNRRDEVVATKILSPTFKFRASLGPESFGIEAFLGYGRSIHSALSDYRCTIEDLVENGRRAVARMRFEGRHRGVFLGVQPTERDICWAGAAFFTTDGQRIAELWVLGDVDAVKRQLS